MAGAGEAVVVSQSTHVLPLEFNRRYPVIVRGEGVWVEDASGKRYLDAMSGGSMAATLGHGRRDIIAAARVQAEKLAYVHNERLTNPLQEQLAHELAGVAPTRFTRVRFVTGGSRPWVRRTCRLTFASRSAPPPSPRTARQSGSGRVSPNVASATAS